MTELREILAKNLKKYRRRLGITQPELAEMAGMSRQYLAVLEIAQKFPTDDMIVRLATALDIQPHELFSVTGVPENAVDRLQKSLLVTNEKLDTLALLLEASIEKGLTINGTKKRKKKS